MNESTARIEITRHEICRGRYYNTFNWMGNPTGIARIDKEIYGKQQLPWKLAIVKEDILCNAYIVARRDHTYFFSFTYHWIREKTFALYYGIKCRTIMTLMCWGLAYVCGGCIPQWKDIFKKAN